MSNPTKTLYAFYTGLPSTWIYDFDTNGLAVSATYDDGTVVDMDLDDITITPTQITSEIGEQEITLMAANGVTTTVTVEVIEKDLSTATEIYITPTTLGETDNTSGFWAVLADDVQVPSGSTYKVNFTNYSSGAANWNNWYVILRDASTETEYAVLRSDNYGWGTGYGTNANFALSGDRSDWATWLSAMNGAAVTAYISNNGDGTADVYVEMIGTDGVTYYQYYSFIDIDSNDCYLSFTVDGSYYVFATE